MAQERPREGAGPARAAHAAPEGRGGISQIIGAAVRQLRPLDVTPHGFGGVQLRRVPGEPLDLQPGALRGEPVADQHTFVRRQLIPDQDRAPAAEMTG